MVRRMWNICAEGLGVYVGEICWKTVAAGLSVTMAAAIDVCVPYLHWISDHAHTATVLLTNAI